MLPGVTLPTAGSRVCGARRGWGTLIAFAIAAGAIDLSVGACVATQCMR